MAREIVLDVGVGYDPKKAPTVLVNMAAAGVQYRARKPKDTAPLAMAEFQILGWEIQELGHAIGESPDDEEQGAARRQAGQLQAKLSELRAKVRQLAEAVLSEKDAEDLLERVFDTSRANAGVEIATVMELHEVVQRHFADEIAEDYEAAGLEPPEQVKKAAKQTTAKKTAAKNTSRKPTRKKAAARP